MRRPHRFKASASSSRHITNVQRVQALSLVGPTSPISLTSRTLLVTLLFVSLLWGCDENRDPQTPDGALRLFGVALADGDAQVIRDSLSAPTHAKLNETLSLLQEVQDHVKRFPSDRARRWAQQEALGELAKPLESISTPDQLLTFLIKDKLEWAKRQPAGEVEQGLNVRKVISDEGDLREVLVLTRAQDQVKVRLEQRAEGRRWVVCAFEPQLDAYIKALKSSISALKDNRGEWTRRKRLNLALPKAP